MFALFRRAKVVPTLDETIGKIRQTIDILTKRESLLEKRVQDRVAEARQCLSMHNKRGALSALKSKKGLENQIQCVAEARDKLEQQVMVIEGAVATMEVLSVMKEGAGAMKAIHKDMSAEKVDNLMEDVREQMDVSDGISKALGYGETLEDDDLLSELNVLEQQIMDEQLITLVPGVPIGSDGGGGGIEPPTTPILNSKQESC